MPRLSIIIPHRNDQQLEETILSVLENRPRDCEIIVAHDGSYHDPYDLADEVVYVQEEPKSTVVELMNAGLMAACSPVVCTLLDGLKVSANWAELALKRFARTEVGAVAPHLQVGRRVITGISADAIYSASKLRSGQVEKRDAEAAAPTLAVGFFRRKLLLALGGWNDEVSAGSADVELALLMSALEVVCEREPEIVVTASSESVPNRGSQQTIRELAGIAAAHGIASPSLGATVSSIIASALTGSLPSALAWSAGLKNDAVTGEVRDRLAFAKKQLDGSQPSVSIKFQSNGIESRRAA